MAGHKGGREIQRWIISHGNHAVEASSWDEAEFTVVRISCLECGYLDVRHVLRPEDARILMERAMRRFLVLPGDCGEARKLMAVRRILRA